jgi:hypothetical protein
MYNIPIILICFLVPTWIAVKQNVQNIYVLFYICICTPRSPQVLDAFLREFRIFVKPVTQNLLYFRAWLQSLPPSKPMREWAGH